MVAEDTGVVGFSPTLGLLVLEVALEAKNVLLTETDLKVAGRLADEVRMCPFSSRFAGSCLEASVSEPLLLTSAEFTTSSTMSCTNLSTIVVLGSPFASDAAGASAEEISETSGLPSSFFAWAVGNQRSCDESDADLGQSAVTYTQNSRSRSFFDGHLWRGFRRHRPALELLIECVRVNITGRNELVRIQMGVVARVK